MLVDHYEQTVETVDLTLDDVLFSGRVTFFTLLVETFDNKLRAGLVILQFVQFTFCFLFHLFLFLTGLTTSEIWLPVLW